MIQTETQASDPKPIYRLHDLHGRFDPFCPRKTGL